MPCDDCSRAEQCPPCVNEEPLCRCGHPEERHTTSLPEEGREKYCTECDGDAERHSFEPEDPPLTPEEEEEAWACVNAGGCSNILSNQCAHGCRDAADELSREAQELPPPAGPEYMPCLTCGHIEPEHDLQALRCIVAGCKCKRYSVEPSPPQPERRPPLAYAYSVQGHLYEVALSGDATVVAQDGALIITHSLGPVAGIVQARPLGGEQS